MLRGLLFAMLSSILLALAFPRFDLSFLVWVALVPLLLITISKGAKHSFLLSFINGGVFFLIIFYWILDIAGYTALHHAILAVYLGLYFAFFGMMTSAISRSLGPSIGLLTAPFIWVALEYIRSNMSFMALPWGLLAHSQYENLPVIQIASITGMYGISFLIVLVNAGITALLHPVFYRAKAKSLHSVPSFHNRMMVVGICAVCLIGFLFYGYLNLSRPLGGDAVKVSLVQGNIEQTKKWDRKQAKLIMQKYADLTLQASKDKPLLIVWPETATPDSINKSPTIYKDMVQLALKAKSYLLFGSARRQKFREHRSKESKYANSAFLINVADGKIDKQRYDKIRLFPFGEYLPYKDTIPWAAINVPGRRGYVPGKEFTVFKLSNYLFAVTICWENIFPQQPRQFVKRGAQFIVNITNEAWFGKSAAPYQFLSMNVFRAVENRVPLIRCANTGISCFIDQYGRVFDRIRDDQGHDIFVEGTLTRNIQIAPWKTFYTTYGDIFVYLSIFLSVLVLIYSLLKYKKNV